MTLFDKRKREEIDLSFHEIQHTGTIKNLIKFAAFSPKKPLDLAATYGDLSKHFPYQVFYKQLGRGSNGSVFSVVSTINNTFSAVKIFRLDSKHSLRRIERERNNQFAFASLGIAPTIRGPLVQWTHNGHSFAAIIMESVVGTVSSLLKLFLEESEAIQIQIGIANLMGLMAKHNFSHNDLHLKNIAYTYQPDHQGILRFKFLLLDFDFSLTENGHALIDWLHLARTTWDRLQRSKKKNPDSDFTENLQYLFVRFLEPVLLRKYGIDKQDYRRVFETESRKLEKTLAAVRKKTKTKIPS